MKLSTPSSSGGDAAQAIEILEATLKRDLPLADLPFGVRRELHQRQLLERFDQWNSGIGSNGLTLAKHALLSEEYAAQYPETVQRSGAELGVGRSIQS